MSRRNCKQLSAIECRAQEGAEETTWAKGLGAWFEVHLESQVSNGEETYSCIRRPFSSGENPFANHRYMDVRFIQCET